MAGELGRIPNPPDTRDLNFPMALHLSTVATPRPRSKLWRAGRTKIDQGPHGYCVGFAGANWLQSLPTYTKVNNQTGIDLYMGCKAVDGIPDVEGSYDRALMQVLAAQGRIERYLWARNMAEVVDWLLTTGPILVGTNWYSGQDNPDSAGVIHATGTVRGGHEYLLRGVDLRKGLARVVNSWGNGWAQRGEAWIPLEDVDRLVFSEGGDACSAVERKP